MSPGDDLDNCPECGGELRTGAEFCTHCGATISAKVSAARRRNSLDRKEARRLVTSLKIWVALLATNGLIGLGFLIEAVDPLLLELVGVGLMTALILKVVIPEERVRQGLVTPGSILGLALVPLALLGLGLFMWAYWTGLGAVGAELLDAAEGYREHGWPLAVVLVVVLPPLTEEVFFRGALQAQLEDVMSAREALIVQAALFSVLHMLPLVFVSHFIMGLVFGFLRRRTGSLWPGIAAHAAWNGWVLFQDWAG